MNLTKQDKVSRMIKKFFEKELMPLSDTLKKNGVSFFPLKPDHNQQTYYSKRPQTKYSDAAMTENHGLVSDDYETINDLEHTLTSLWESQGYPQLIALAPSLSKTAQLCYAVEKEEQQTEEISPEMYTMF